MIQISTTAREKVEMEGATYTVRALTGAEVISVASNENSLIAAARFGLTEISGVEIDGRPATVKDIELLPSAHIVAIALKAKEMSHVGEASKNS